MIFTTIVEHDQSGINMILSVIESLEKDRFVEGIRLRTKKIEEVSDMVDLIGECQHKMNKELKHLVRFSKDFIRLYATDNNQCFATTQVLFNRIRSTLKSIREIFQKTSETDHRKLLDKTEAPSIFDRSILANGEYTPDLFGIESFPKVVNDLYEAIDTLFSTASTVLALCNLMIEKENEVRGDTDLLRRIFNDTCNEFIGFANGITILRKTDPNLLANNELEIRRKKAGSENEEKFLKENYHKHGTNVMKEYAFIKLIREARNEGLTEIEAYFWNDNHEKAKAVREVVANLDQIIGIKDLGVKINSTSLVELLKWCGVPEKKEMKLYKEYIIPEYNKHNGKNNLLGWSSISAQRKLLKKCGDTDEKLAADFDKRVKAYKSSLEKHTHIEIQKTA